jgi:hypothetical protein
MASIIKADNIQKVSDGTNIIKKCGSTTTIGSGACSPIVICGSTVTLGRCGGTVTLACGATQSGFGRTGTVDWCTTAKTAPFTGVSGNGYFVNTACGAVTVTLPATPTAGDIISIADYASTFQTNNVTLCNNGSLINGICATAKLNTQGQSITLVYVDGTKGWKNTMDSTSDVTGASFIVATGGTETNSPCGDYKIHTFTSDGSFTISSTSANPTNNNIDYLVVAGGGGGGYYYGGGGGAGGYRESCGTSTGCYTVSPLAAPCGAITAAIQTYPITVGGGGAGRPSASGGLGTDGTNSIFSTITSTGGGAGGGAVSGVISGNSGGSGGGAGGTSSGGSGGAGNTPPVSPPQGQPGSGSGPNEGAGGGGASAAGSGKTGGNGVSTSITGAGVYRSGGGSGGPDPSPSPLGGGGKVDVPGTINTGGGGGGDSGNGGPGIVIIRYKYQ